MFFKALTFSTRPLLSENELLLRERVQGNNSRDQCKHEQFFSATDISSLGRVISWEEKEASDAGAAPVSGSGSFKCNCGVCRTTGFSDTGLKVQIEKRSLCEFFFHIVCTNTVLKTNLVHHTS